MVRPWCNRGTTKQFRGTTKQMRGKTVVCQHPKSAPNPQFTIFSIPVWSWTVWFVWYYYLCRKSHRIFGKVSIAYPIPIFNFKVHTIYDFIWHHLRYTAAWMKRWYYCHMTKMTASRDDHGSDVIAWSQPTILFYSIGTCMGNGMGMAHLYFLMSYESSVWFLEEWCPIINSTIYLYRTIRTSGH